MTVGTKKGIIKDFAVDILFDIAAAILYAVSVNMFTAPIPDHL